MTLATDKQLKQREKKLKDLLKQVDNAEKLSREKKDKKLLSVLRSCVRKVWMRHPTKLLKLELAVEQDNDPNTRTIWKVKCERCSEYFKKNEVEIDHIDGEHSLKTFSELEDFIKSILDVSLSDLNVICKQCHQIKTYAERHGVDENTAEIKLKQIAWTKVNTVGEQKKFLLENGFNESDVSNNTKRMKSYIIFLGENNG
jgi:hypothetical protein